MTNASRLTFGLNDELYALSAPIYVGPAKTSSIFKIDVSTGAATLYAENLPFMTDIAFAKASVVPEPQSATVWFLGALVLLVLRKKRGL